MNERDKLIVERVAADTPTLMQPNCPKCRYSPLEFMCNVARTPLGHLVAVIWCGHCGHTLQTQFLGVDQEQGPRIVRPS